MKRRRHSDSDIRRELSDEAVNEAWHAIQVLEDERDYLKTTVQTLEAQLRGVIEDIRNMRKVWKCAICFDDFLPDNLYILDKCNHKYCSKCLNDYVDAMVLDAHTTIVCPDCKAPMEHHEALQLMKPEYRTRFEKICLDRALSTMNDVLMCPSADCGNAFIRDPASRDIHCMSCEHRFCADCKRVPHPDIPRCEDVEQILKTREEVASEAWVAGYARPCPQCHAPIQKDSGCNHMKCGLCKYNFCWICMGEYAAGHFSAGRCQQYGDAHRAVPVRSESSSSSNSE